MQVVFSSSWNEADLSVAFCPSVSSSKKCRAPRKRPCLGVLEASSQAYQLVWKPEMALITSGKTSCSVV